MLASRQVISNNSLWKGRGGEGGRAGAGEGEEGRGGEGRGEEGRGRGRGGEGRRNNCD